jgi:hypothetical protein
LKQLNKLKRHLVWKRLLELNARNVEEFMRHLERSVKRQINAIRIIPLHGSAHDCVTVPEAMKFVESYDEKAGTGPFVKYEIVIRYDSEDKVQAELLDKATALDFLHAYLSGNWTPAIGAAQKKVE